MDSSDGLDGGELQLRVNRYSHLVWFLPVKRMPEPTQKPCSGQRALASMYVFYIASTLRPKRESQLFESKSNITVP